MHHFTIQSLYLSVMELSLTCWFIGIIGLCLRTEIVLHPQRIWWGGVLDYVQVCLLPVMTFRRAPQRLPSAHFVSPKVKKAQQMFPILFQSLYWFYKLLRCEIGTVLVLIHFWAGFTPQKTRHSGLRPAGGYQYSLKPSRASLVSRTFCIAGLASWQLRPHATSPVLHAQQRYKRLVVCCFALCGSRSSTCRAAFLKT